VAAFDLIPTLLIFKFILRAEVEYCSGFHPA